MPCPHFEVKIRKRSSGQSAVAGAAYQSGETLFSEYDQKKKSYGSKNEILYTAILLPDNAPEEYADRQTLWNAVEKKENQWNAQLARGIIMALPREVPSDQYPQMVREYCQEYFVSKGMCADIAIHDKGDGNPHAHIMLTMRAIDEHGKWMPKCRKVYDLDENGERIRLPSSQWKSHRENVTDWDDRGNCEIWRHGWETIQNQYLEKANRPERVDLRSYKRQGIDKIPTVHMGPAVTYMEKRGERTMIGDLNREIREKNSIMASLRERLQQIRGFLGKLWQQLASQPERESPDDNVLYLLNKYMDMRALERFSRDSGNARQKGALNDLQSYAGIMMLLNRNQIRTVQDLAGRLETAMTERKTLSAGIREIKGRMANIDAIFEAAEKMQKLQPVQEAYNANYMKSVRQKFATEHAEELAEYNSIDRFLRKMQITLPLTEGKVKTLQSEKAELQEALTPLLAAREAANTNIDDLKKLRWCIGQVRPDVLEHIQSGRTSVLAELEMRKRNMEETGKRKEVARKKDRGTR